MGQSKNSADTAGGREAEPERMKSMNGVLVLLLVLAGWFLLQGVILPKLGIRT